MLLYFWTLLAEAFLEVSQHDSLWWKGCKDGKFTVNSSYHLLAELWRSIEQIGHANHFGRLKLDPKSCFGWLAAHEACLTQETLQKKRNQLMWMMLFAKKMARQ